MTLRLRERFYYQIGRQLLPPHYTAATLQPFVTADRELSTFWSNVVGAKISWRLPWVHRALEVEAKVDYLLLRLRQLRAPGVARRADIEAGLNVIY